MGEHEWEPVLAPMSNRRCYYSTTTTYSNSNEDCSKHFDAVVVVVVAAGDFCSLSSRRGNGPVTHKIAANPWPLMNMAVKCH